MGRLRTMNEGNEKSRKCPSNQTTSCWLEVYRTECKQLTPGLAEVICKEKSWLGMVALEIHGNCNKLEGGPGVALKAQNMSNSENGKVRIEKQGITNMKQGYHFFNLNQNDCKIL